MLSKVILPDELDLQILHALQTEARASYAELSKRFGLSAPAITERVRKLEEAGLILGYHARFNPVLLEQGLLAFIGVTLTRTQGAVGGDCAAPRHPRVPPHHGFRRLSLEGACARHRRTRGTAV
jgi:DNA-binding Lrp family transcriptional regulator